MELFFKWIKQNLRIKHFFGTTDNAVKTQVWIAICVCTLAALRQTRQMVFASACCARRGANCQTGLATLE
jgi:IS4 transposase